MAGVHVHSSQQRVPHMLRSGLSAVIDEVRALLELPLDAAPHQLLKPLLTQLLTVEHYESALDNQQAYDGLQQEAGQLWVSCYMY